MEEKKPRKGYPSYDDDRFFETEVASSNDCTGLIPSAPKDEAEAEAYADLMNIPQPKGKVDNGFQRLRPQEEKDK